LAINTDRAFQETQLEYAQQRASILNIAKNMGFNIPAKRPSVTVVDFTVTVPVLGDAPDASYFPVLAAGAQVIGGGKIFETTDKIDFSTPLSNLGTPNRAWYPNKDPNGIIVSYRVVKREVVVNGSSNIFKRTIATTDVVPFFQVTLPDPDVLEISNIILMEGTNFSSNPTDADFNNPQNQYYEVDYLAQQRVFTIDPNNSKPNADGIKAATWIDVTKKFIKEFTPNGYCRITFGSGDSDVNAFKQGFLKAGVSNVSFLDNFLSEIDQLSFCTVDAIGLAK
jgi:hypothetical protein